MTTPTLSKKTKSSNLTTYHSNGKVVELWQNANFLHQYE